ncbi:hypothetical protein MUBE_05850 [Mycobacterium uberis]|uniref:Aldehyde dehydrogenase domain-containing protein n=1 Tax=Mycobacterium uberis TaxID=2162698 RepID=A0A3E1HI70_9MYCO|nr:hypothetical protein MUBE_05850 [Mycobacterium uberis]
MVLLADGVSELFIDGKMLSGGARTCAPINSGIEEVLAVATEADVEEVGRALDAAQRVFDETGWSGNTELWVRRVCQLCDAMRNHIDELQELSIAAVGAPRLLTASAQFEGPADDLGFVADMTKSYLWNQGPGALSPMGILTRRAIARETVGIVGLITSWNLPRQINLAELGPALAVGNTVVLKPVLDTLWCATVLGELIFECSQFSPVIVNILISSDHDLGVLLVKDPQLEMISFIDSIATGCSVMVEVTVTSKKVFLEFGDKSVFVVLDDADLAAASGISAFLACVYAGQGCAITTRLVVLRDRYKEGVAVAAATMSSIKPDAHSDPGTVCGPLVSARQRDRIQGYLDLAIFDIRTEVMAPLVEIGTTEATALSDMTDIDIISVAVLDSEQVREIVAGESKLDLKTKPSNIVAIHFTISDTTVVNLARKIAPQGIRVVVAPLVSGGSAVVAKGELVTRVGVDDEKFQRSKEPFQRWASLVVHVGELGAGARMKMARNMLTFVSYTAAAEALQLAGRLRIGHRGTWENFAAQQSSDRWRRSVHVPQC